MQFRLAVGIRENEVEEMRKKIEERARSGDRQNKS
jgi:hypothetical protein